MQRSVCVFKFIHIILHYTLPIQLRIQGELGSVHLRVQWLLQNSVFEWMNQMELTLP